MLQRLALRTDGRFPFACCAHVLAVLAAVGTVASWDTAAAQTPAPFPRPGQQQQQPVSRPLPPTAAPAVAQPATSAQPGDPTEATLGAPIYPGAQFIASYDAGTGQRYYLFGTVTDFSQIVTYYRTLLKQKGDLIFEDPPIQMFDLAKFKEETMAFPPSVTVKDYTRGGSDGYLNPKPGAAPARFKTVIQIVPGPPATAVPK
ncbi:MAG: hypothetical protein ABI818_13940 [Acidobacteriota bacterium]